MNIFAREDSVSSTNVYNIRSGKNLHFAAFCNFLYHLVTIWLLCFPASQCLLITFSQSCCLFLFVSAISITAHFSKAYSNSHPFHSSPSLTSVSSSLSYSLQTHLHILSSHFISLFLLLLCYCMTIFLH